MVDQDLEFWNTFFEIALDWEEILRQVYEQPGLDQV